MKKILVLLALLLPAFAIVSNSKNLKESNPVSTEVTKVNEYNILATVNVALSDVKLPFVITVPAPSERVTGINGPVQPNIQNWKVENGYLTITYTRRTEIMDLLDCGTFNIEVPTSPMRYYVIKLIVE